MQHCTSTSLAAGCGASTRCCTGRAVLPVVLGPRYGMQGTQLATVSSLTCHARRHAEVQQQQQQQQQQQANPSISGEVAVSTAEVTYKGALPMFASISRVFVSKSSWMGRLTPGKVSAPSGPVSLLLAGLGLVMAILAAVRAILVQRVKSCECCKGYGITRCKLCNGIGKVDWRAKFIYSEGCPLCMSKRYVSCPECGGHHFKPIFSHVPASSTEGLNFAPRQ